MHSTLPSAIGITDLQITTLKKVPRCKYPSIDLQLQYFNNIPYPNSVAIFYCKLNMLNLRMHPYRNRQSDIW